jgi:hypothetical protein
MPEKLDLAEFITVQEESSTAREKVDAMLVTSPLVKLLTTGDLPKPLTYDEALAIDDEIAATQAAIKVTRARITTMLGRIDGIGFGSGGGQEISFKLDISKRAALRRAVRQAFGVKTDTITYSMYKAAVEAKKKLEKSEASDYVNMKWKK